MAAVKKYYIGELQKNTQGMQTLQPGRYLGMSSSAVRQSDPIQAIFLGKVKEYSKLAAAGKLDQAGVDAEIAAAKARLGGSGDMTAFPKLEFSDPDFAHAVEFKLQ